MPLTRTARLKRTKRLERGTKELARGKPPERKTRMKWRSDKRAAGAPERHDQVEAAFIRDGWEWTEDDGWVGGRCIPHERGWPHPEHCYGQPTPHRLRKGSNQGRYTTDNVVAACAFSNSDIENHSKLAKRLGLVNR